MEFARPAGNERSCNASVECKQEIITEHRRHTHQEYHKRGHFQEASLQAALLTSNFSRPNVYVLDSSKKFLLCSSYKTN